VKLFLIYYYNYYYYNFKVEADCAAMPHADCQLFIPMKQLKNMVEFYKKPEILKILKSIPTKVSIFFLIIYLIYVNQFLFD